MDKFVGRGRHKVGCWEEEGPGRWIIGSQKPGSLEDTYLLPPQFFSGPHPQEIIQTRVTVMHSKRKIVAHAPPQFPPPLKFARKMELGE